MVVHGGACRVQRVSRWLTKSRGLEVVDNTMPTIACNVRDITPPHAPITFTATATDNCSVAAVAVTGYDCWMING